VLGFRGVEPVGERPAVQQRRQQHVPTVAQRQHQRQLIAVKHLAQRLTRVNAEVHTAILQRGKDLLLGARRSIREHLPDRGCYLSQRLRDAHPTDATHPRRAAAAGRPASIQSTLSTAGSRPS
jgi:hypothetical protein